MQTTRTFPSCIFSLILEFVLFLVLDGTTREKKSTPSPKTEVWNLDWTLLNLTIPIKKISSTYDHDFLKMKMRDEHYERKNLLQEIVGQRIVISGVERRKDVGRIQTFIVKSHPAAHSGPVNQVSSE